VEDKIRKITVLATHFSRARFRVVELYPFPLCFDEGCVCSLQLESIMKTDTVFSEQLQGKVGLGMLNIELWTSENALKSNPT
jgi:hypothetical protein